MMSASMPRIRFGLSGFLLVVALLNLAFAVAATVYRGRAAVARIRALGGRQLSRVEQLAFSSYDIENMPLDGTLRLPPSKDVWDRKRDRSQFYWGAVPYTFGDDVGDEDLGILNRLADVRYLDLTFTDIGDEGVANLQDLEDLEILLLGYTGITDNAGDALRFMPAVRVLSLAHTDIGDKGLSFLATMEQLEMLNLESTRVTSRSLQYLHRLKCLKEIDLSGTSVSLDAVLALKRELPKLKVIKKDGW